MKRHLLGFAFFNLIVGTALIIAITTGNFPRPATRSVYNVSEQPANYTYEVSKQSCWRNVRQNSSGKRSYDRNPISVKVTQAILDEETNNLNVSFSIQRETPSTQQVKLRLIFINGSYQATDGKFDETIRREPLTISPAFDVDNKAVYSIPLSYKWLKNSDAKENFYVMAEIDNGNLDNSETVARKNTTLNDFTPILLMNEK